MKAYLKEWRRKNPNYQKNYLETHPEKPEYRAAISRRYRERNELKILARKAIFKATRNGSIVRLPCFCGIKKTEAHHEDYSKPLDIQWLCKKHHVEADKRLSPVSP